MVEQGCGRQFLALETQLEQEVVVNQQGGEQQAQV
jgi:hypothetical protein